MSADFQFPRRAVSMRRASAFSRRIDGCAFAYRLVRFSSRFGEREPAQFDGLGRAFASLDPAGGGSLSGHVRLLFPRRLFRSGKWRLRNGLWLMD
jgi:hypothetical protein